MSSIEEIRNTRIKKLEILRKKGINPYPSESKRELSLKEAREKFAALEKSGAEKWLAGRVMSIRGQGKIIFVTLNDGTDRFQALLKQDVLGGEKFNLFEEAIDIGDFVELQGIFLRTKSGEETIEAKDWRVLSKSLRPLPEKWHGLEDEEIKLRKRYLDILTDPEVKKIFIDKNKFWTSMRQFMVKSGFLEMEMPTLEPLPGGAEAEPFVTHHRALDEDFYLRISLELPLKKMLVASYEKVFEIGRIFRNEGISSTHLQDYTQIEFYWAYADFPTLLNFIEELYQYVIKETFGTFKIKFREQEMDWEGNWERVDYLELFKENTGIDLGEAKDAELKKYLDKKNVKYESFTERGRLLDLIFKEVRKNGIKWQGVKPKKPFFLINQPIELEPLAKRDEKNPKIVQRMQVIAYSMELGKGFGELNDPLDQRARFEAQMKLREKGDTEAQMLDEDYLEAMEYGMPPCVGFGASERLFSVLKNISVREGVVFPLMKPRK
ncbi:lysine--tRNA ligase [Candidatus Nomurabacteria bacterium RIFCSPLOWO2_01_FULL_46_18]|uniref:Lysine--tRNA ligase n=1 Tax=Candidatus Nomurabacteria bacterium RIFCSPLOWO2_01_FULL_46_18 TaxID=1801783 RepID=A0A1F6XE94_9BACT|nr:MAG: lysine--tRNA ligase [Candidatus Nomurabacteria bacterium RIFCSPLOWO2_01_FULL_46_18]